GMLRLANMVLTVTTPAELEWGIGHLCLSLVSVTVADTGWTCSGDMVATGARSEKSFGVVPA
ncbi:hypothetical protein ACC687_39145, partial [Rhizobium ruizarguesonis]